MKKLLLFTLSIGLATLGFAQTNVSVDSFLDPAGTVLVGDSGPENTIRINMTNNAGKDYLATENNTVSFSVTVDGVVLADPTGGNWIRPMTFDFLNGATEEFILAQTWVASQTPGNYEICVTIEMILEGGNSPQSNTDANKQLCQSFDFANPTGINNLNSASISNVTTSGDIMNVFIKNASSQIQINVLDVTGRIVKTTTPVIGGQDFNERINISDLTSGVYIVTIQNDNGILSTQKVFVQ